MTYKLHYELYEDDNIRQGVIAFLSASVNRDGLWEVKNIDTADYCIDYEIISTGETKTLAIGNWLMLRLGQDVKK